MQMVGLCNPLVPKLRTRVRFPSPALFHKRWPEANQRSDEAGRMALYSTSVTARPRRTRRALHSLHGQRVTAPRLGVT